MVVLLHNLLNEERSEIFYKRFINKDKKK